MIREGDLKEASRHVNIALSLSSRNPVLHLINGFIYEEMTKLGYGSYSELTEIAYTSAYNLDPTQWYIVYLYGRHMLAKGDYRNAQKLLSEALLLNRNNIDIMHCLAYASYYSQDIAMAAASIEKASLIKKNDPAIARSAAIIFASAGKDQKARNYFERYKKEIGENAKKDIRFVSKKLADWKNAYQQSMQNQSSPFLRKADVDLDVDPDGGADAIQESQREAEEDMQKNKEELAKTLEEEEEEETQSNQMQSKKTAKAEKYIPIIIECYILNVIESNSTSKGSNLLDALSDNISLSLSGDWSRGYQFPINPRQPMPNEQGIQTSAGNRQSNTYTKNLDFAVSDSGIKYNLNIMNAVKKTVEILGRPTVVTMLGEKAVFMSGSQILGGSQSTFSSALQSVDVGMKVEIVPIKITSKNKLILNVTVSGSSMSLPPDSGRALDAQTFSIEKSKTTTTVKAAFDQTVLMSCLYQRVQTTGKSQVPFLGDIPGIQYFFSNQQTSNSTNTILYLLTPRRGGVVNKSTATFGAHASNPNDSLTRRLEERGIVAIGDYMALRYILKSMSDTSLFINFQTGDLLLPYYGRSCSDLNGKLEMMLSFLYF